MEMSSVVTKSIGPILDAKRHIAVIIPYQKRSEGNLFFLQMRDEHAPTNANKFSLFGGGLDDGETAEEAMLRELQEELEYSPKNLKYFLRSETGTRISEVFIEEVGDDFEKDVVVHEGLYGKFLSLEEIEHADNVSFLAKTLVAELNAWLNGIKL
jgi:8-oxo-dGTP diphosphatase